MNKIAFLLLFVSFPVLADLSTTPGSSTQATDTGAAASLTAISSTTTANGVLLGPVTETAPATDTASSGLNGRLQRIAQNISSAVVGVWTTISNTLINGIGMFLDRSNTCVLTAACADGVDPCPVASTCELNAQGTNSVTTVNTGAWVGNVVVDGRLDPSVPWKQITVFDISKKDANGNQNANYCKDFTVWGNAINGVDVTPDYWSGSSAGYDRVRLRQRALTSGVDTTIMKVSSGTNYCVPFQAAVSLGNNSNKTQFMEPAQLTTTATTADQVVLAHTITTSKTYFLQHFEWEAQRTTFQTDATTSTSYGTCSIESPAGSKIYTRECAGVTKCEIQRDAAEPMFFSGATAGTVVRIVCTPASATSTSWRANFIGYEK